MANSFNACGINENLVKALKNQDITIPTEIQEKSIPELISGKDFIGCSETGSGKTLAYLLPLLMKIDVEKRSNQAVILAPTHELAMQIFKEIEKLVNGSEMKVTSAQCIGGANIYRQIDKLKKRPHIIVGSAGRILELIKTKKIDPAVKTVIIDEADRMLDDDNFETLLRLIRSLIRTERQTVLFSASIQPETLKRAKAVTKNAVYVKTALKPIVNEGIEHLYIECDERDKIQLVRKIYAAFPEEQALVFLNSDDLISGLAEKLLFHKLKISAIHGRFKKFERKTALENFRKGKARFLISSDISARGLDFSDVDLIINFDMPIEPLDYLHRSGRTARAGKKGRVVSLVTQSELKILQKHAKHFKFDFGKVYFQKGEMHFVK
jgi:ATP-dependent RNA helicase DeaD